MKKKFQKTLQQPIVISLLVVVMIVSLGFALYYSQPPVVEETETPVYALVGVDDVRSGQQKLGISILPEDGESGDSEGLFIAEEVTISPEGENVLGLKYPEALENFVPGNAQIAGLQAGSALDANDIVRFKIDRFQKLATQPLKFNVYDGDRELKPDDLISMQGEKIHLYIVHANMGEFMHITPDYTGGVWRASANIPTPGTYYAYVVFHQFRKSPTVYKNDLVVRNESPDDLKKADPTSGLEFDDGNLRTTMSMQRLNGNRIFDFQIMKGADLAMLEPYLETLGHVTFFRHDDPFAFSAFTSILSSDEVDGSASFTATSGQFTRGRYTAFSEFKVGGKVYIFPFTFDIGTL